MRLIGKLLALPFVLVTGILYLVCKFLVVVSGAVLGILSGIVFLAALALFFAAGFWPGLSWLVIAFLISPYGLPMAAAWLVGERDMPGLAFLLRTAEPEAAELAAARDLARESGAAEALALLLEQQRDEAPRGLDKTFDL